MFSGPKVCLKSCLGEARVCSFRALIAFLLYIVDLMLCLDQTLCRKNSHLTTFSLKLTEVCDESLLNCCISEERLAKMMH